MTGAYVKEEALTDIARRALEQVCTGEDLDAARELYAPDCLDHVDGMEFRGQEGIRRSVGMYRAIFPDLRIEVEDQVRDDDRVVSRWTLHGTHRGKRASISGITISRFADGRIVEDWTSSDSLGLLRQLGLWRSLLLGLRFLTGRLA